MRIIYLILSLLVIFTAAAALSLLGIRFFVISSGSMEPKLSRGDIIVTQTKDSYAIGDLISFQQHGGVVTHQIIAKRVNDGETSYQTKGSANEAADNGFVASTEVVGKVFHAVPRVGLLFLLPKKLYVISVMWAMSLVVIVLELKQLRISIQEKIA